MPKTYQITLKWKLDEKDLEFHKASTKTDYPKLADEMWDHWENYARSNAAVIFKLKYFVADTEGKVLKKSKFETPEEE